MMGFINLFLFLFFFPFSFSVIPSGGVLTEVTDTGGNPLQEEVLYYIKSDSEGYVTVDHDNRLRFQRNNFQSVTDMKFKFSPVSDTNYIQIKTETGIEVFTNIASDRLMSWYLMAGEKKPENVSHVFAIEKNDDDLTWSLFVIFNSKAHPVFSGANVLYTNAWSWMLDKGIPLKFDLVSSSFSTLPSGGATEITDTGGIPLQPTALYYIKSDLYGYVIVDFENRLRFGSNNSQSVTNTKFMFSAVGNGNYIQIKTETGIEVFARFNPGSGKPWYLMAGKKPKKNSHEFGMEIYDDDDDGTWSLFVIFNSKAHAVFAGENGLYTNEEAVGSKGIAFKFERVQ